MTKRIVARTGEYTNAQGEVKAEWTRVGIIGSSANGEYVLLDPTVNLSGVLQKQNMLAQKKIKAGDEKAKIGSSVMCSVFDDSNQGQQSGGGQSGGGAPRDDFDQDIPF